MFRPTLCPDRVLITIWKSLALLTRLIQPMILCECLFYGSCYLMLTQTVFRYEMYAEDSNAPSAAHQHQRDDGEGAHIPESGPAIEVIELANGETIWCVACHVDVLKADAHNVFRSIVNGLRGDDNESFYGDRASFASEYSLRDGQNDGVQLHFKEHARSGSKGSMNSFMSSKKQGTVNRPETKVRQFPDLC